MNKNGQAVCLSSMAVMSPARGVPDALASMDGFSSSTNHRYPISNHQNQPFLCYNNVNGGGSIMMRRRNSLRNISSRSPFSSPRSGRFFDGSGRFDEFHSPQAHFLEACFLCNKPLGGNHDIFMYRFVIFT